MREIKLTEEQMQEVIIEWSKEYQHCGDACLCGCYHCTINGIGMLSLETSCRSTSACPTGMDWCIHDKINVWTRGVYPEDTCHITPEEMCYYEDEYIGVIEEVQAKELIKVARQSMIRDYSFNGCSDEYGNVVNYTEDKIRFKGVVNKGLKNNENIIGSEKFMKNLKKYTFLEAISYVYETGESLYDIKKDRKMCQNEYREVVIDDKNKYTQSVVIDDKNMNSIWITSNKKTEFNIRAYCSNKLVFNTVQKILNTDNNLEKAKRNIANKVSNQISVPFNEIKLIVEEIHKI